MRKYAMLGKWHVHADEYANGINALPGCKIVKVWDPDAEVAKAWAEKLQCEAASLEDILGDAEIEGVVITTATNEHPEVMQKVCASGKAMFTEKVLTLSVEDAEAVRKAVVENNIRFAISFPHLSRPTVQFLMSAAKSGKLGKINYARVRNVHDGAVRDWLPPHFYDPIPCGGGAMIDLGAHPMYLLAELLGMPEKVQSAFTHVTGKAVEDNAVSLLQFADGAVGVSETSFVSVRYPYIIEVGGDKGSMVLRDNEITYCCPETNNEWCVAELPEALPLPLEQWALAEKPEDIPACLGIDAAVRLTKVMAMAYAE